MSGKSVADVDSIVYGADLEYLFFNKNKLIFF